MEGGSFAIVIWEVWNVCECESDSVTVSGGGVAVSAGIVPVPFSVRCYAPSHVPPRVSTKVFILIGHSFGPPS